MKEQNWIFSKMAVSFVMFVFIIRMDFFCQCRLKFTSVLESLGQCIRSAATWNCYPVIKESRQQMVVVVQQETRHHSSSQLSAFKGDRAIAVQYNIHVRLKMRIWFW